MEFKQEGKWWVSPTNFFEEVTKNFHFPDKIEILDTTLRDGEQEPGIIFTKEDKVAIAKKLDEAGVHRIEAGCPMTSDEDADAIRAICALGLKADIYCFVRGVLSDMDLAKDCGVDGVIIEVPGSEQMLQGGMRWGLPKAIDAAAAATKYAHELGLKVIFFPSDASRSNMEFLTTLLKGVLENGGHMDSVALVDTFGTFSPEGAAYMTRALIEEVGVPVEAHFHEDFGLSVATTIAALEAGAFCAHVTVNGIGERAGSCPLEPLVMSLQCLYGQDTGIKYEKLLELSQEVAVRSGKPVPPTRAITGNRLFGWETGLPTGYWQKSRDINPLIMMPYHYSMTGQPAPHIYIGKKSGAANVALVNERLGLPPIEDKEVVKALLKKVKALSIEVKRDLTDEEYLNLYHEMV
ncbi:MAG: 3-hydroxy-3-methylglutaryl-CoA lyase [Mogibacterium sp.]|nr:3-hydroxy-3-methylglutaryl-CoA lyase [Mogibacterium sp.]